MTGHETLTNIVLLAAPDFDRSGVGSTLRNRVLAAFPASTLEVVVEPGNATTILAQRLDPALGPQEAEVPPTLMDWFRSMFESPVRPNTAALLHSLYHDLVGTAVFQNRTRGYRVQPPDDYKSDWDNQALEWLDRDFELMEPSDPESVGALLKTLKTNLPKGTTLIVSNTSTVFPGGDVLSPSGETMRTRANRLALTLDRAALDSGFLTIDVDQLVAELGADEHVLELSRYSSEACDSIGEEASELILDLPAVNALIESDGMQLVMPRYDRRTSVGVIEKWHLSPERAVKDGDPMFDIRFENLHTRLTERKGRKTGKNLRLTVVAADDGFLHEIAAVEGESVPVGNLVGVMSRDGSSPPGDVSSSRRFRVGVRRDESSRTQPEDQ